MPDSVLSDGLEITCMHGYFAPQRTCGPEMHFTHLSQTEEIPAIDHEIDHVSRSRGRIMIQYHASVMANKNNQSMLPSHQVKNAALEIRHFVRTDKKVSARIPVFTGSWIIVQHTTVGVVERAF
jgi:hypothetical protein